MTDAPPGISSNDKTGTLHTEISRSGDFWLDDGNIVLVAEHTSYKVHRSFLARHSPVFKDILSLPQTGNVGEAQIEGCSVVQLSDSADNIHITLSMLYDSDHQYMSPSITLPFKTVAAMPTVGMKYQIDKLSQEAIRRLKICFPTEFAKFADYNEAIEVVRLASMFDIPAILPAAYYTCAHLSVEELFSAVDTQRWTMSMLQTCIKGQSELRQRDLAQLNVLFRREVSLSCSSENHCRGGMVELLKKLQETRSLSGMEALVPASRWFKDLSAGLVCNACAATCMSAYEDARRETWNGLGGMFGVHPWPITEKAS
ncbi:hypothetical protein C8Q75DRAFT_806624 [Abortiporus biennis]|nr:hypothetical protein C8Q75DRAFT_806624 [Abortiporus biennis]